MRLTLSNFYLVIAVVVSIVATSCSTARPVTPREQTEADPTKTPVERIRNKSRVIHVLVALCDNKNQGIVPVPASLGNGTDPDRNLYWGAKFGVKTYFSKSRDWRKLREIEDPNEIVLSRLIFRHRSKNVYLVADAYRGDRIRDAIVDFTAAAAGRKLENISINGKPVQLFSSANVIAFVGHNGLMDFKIDKVSPEPDDLEKQDAIILACFSKRYFSRHLKGTRTKPILWTSNLMAPEAYILHDAVDAWVYRRGDAEVRNRAAMAYSKYQKISLRASRRLLVSGW